MAGIAFTADPKRHEDDPSALGLASLFHLACLSEGVLIGPGGVLAVSGVLTASRLPVFKEASRSFFAWYSVRSVS